MLTHTARIVGHGSSGVIHFGSLRLDQFTLQSPDIVSGLKAHVGAADAVELLSCQVASGATGRHFVRQFASALGIPVFASSRNVGPAHLGGTYELDFGHCPTSNTQLPPRVADPIEGLNTLLAAPSRYVSATFSRGYIGTQANQQAPQDIYVFGFAGEDAAIESITFRQDDEDGDGLFGDSTGLQGNDLDGELVIQFSGSYGEAQAAQVVLPGYLNFRETPKGDLHVLGFLIYPAPNADSTEGPVLTSAEMIDQAGGWFDYIDNGGATPFATYASDPALAGYPYSDASSDPGYTFQTTLWDEASSQQGADQTFPAGAGGTNTYRLLSGSITDVSANIGLVLETMTPTNPDWAWTGNNADDVPSNYQDRSSLTNAANSGLLDALNEYLVSIAPLSISDPEFVETNDFGETNDCELAYTIVLPTSATEIADQIYAYTVTPGTGIDNSTDWVSDPAFNIDNAKLIDGTALTRVTPLVGDQWSFTDGAATTYTFQDNGDGTLTVPQGVTEFDFCLNVLQDSDEENNETITVNFGSVIGTGTILDDDNPIRINNVTVNENSDWAIFCAEFTAGGQTFSIDEPIDAGTAEDLNTPLNAKIEVWAWDGSGWSWEDASSGVSFSDDQILGNVSVGGEAQKAYIRVKIVNEQDTSLDPGEQFQITTNYGPDSTVGTGTIYDNGTGDIFSADPLDPVSPDPYVYDYSASGASETLDDDRLISVNDPCVSEVSPYTVFTVTGAPQQFVSLDLVSGTATSGVDFDPTLEVWNDATGVWDAATANTFIQLDSDGQILVRHPIIQDPDTADVEDYELHATNTGGTTAIGSAQIHEDSSCTTIFPDAPATGQPNTPVSGTLEITSVIVNEASDYSINRICAQDSEGNPIAAFSGLPVEGLVTSVDPDDPQAVDGITDFDLQFWDGLDWQPYDTNTPPVLDATGCLYVRTSIVEEQDEPVDNNEIYQLIIPAVATGSVTIVDDGTAEIFTGEIDVDGPVTSTDDLDNDGDEQAEPAVTQYFDCSWDASIMDFGNPGSGSYLTAQHSFLDLHLSVIEDAFGNLDLVFH